MCNQQFAEFAVFYVKHTAMKDNPMYPIDCRVGGGDQVVCNGYTSNTEKWSPYNKEKSGIVEARMQTQEVQPTCLWALAASEAGKPESVYAIGVYPGGRPKGKSCLENR